MKNLVVNIEEFGDHSLIGWWVSKGRPPLKKRLYVNIKRGPVSCVINDIEALRAISKKHPELVDPKLIIETSPFEEIFDRFPVDWGISSK